jgi:hypothetical protein
LPTINTLPISTPEFDVVGSTIDDRWTIGPEPIGLLTSPATLPAWNSGPMLLDSLDLTADAFADATGWVAKPEGMCKGDSCVPVPEAMGTDGSFDVAAVAELLGMALVADGDAGVWALGPESGGRALTTATVPPIELPDIDGNPFDLTATHGRKVVLVAWASW